MLEVRTIRAGYGAINVLWDVDLRFDANKLTTIIGPNGAGKTTLLRAIMGQIPITQGEIALDGRRLDGIETWRMIQEVEQLGRREIAKAVLLTRTSPALRTRAQEHARLQYEKVGVKVLETEFMERVAFKEMTFNGAAPNIQDRESNAAKNVITMFDEIIRMLPGQEISRQSAAAQ